MSIRFDPLICLIVAFHYWKSELIFSFRVRTSYIKCAKNFSIAIYDARAGWCRSAGDGEQSGRSFLG
jgi:hypothetical protein